MELNKIFKDGLWSTEINVRDFVSHNITPYYGDASFLEGPTERTKAVWNRCLEALAEERANNGVRSLDNVTVSTITSHKAGYMNFSRPAAQILGQYYQFIRLGFEGYKQIQYNSMEITKYIHQEIGKMAPFVNYSNEVVYSI